MSRAKTISQEFIISLLLGIVFFGTLIATFAIPPEELRLVSEDGRVRVEAQVPAPELARLLVRERDTDPLSFLRGPLYEIDLGIEVLPQPYQLRILYDPSWFGENDPETIRLYYFDERLSAWRIYPFTLDADEEVIEAEIITTASLWSLGISGPEDAKGYEDIVSELISFPPEGAIGFTVSIVAADSDDILLLDSERVRGGCEGQFRLGTSETITTRERRIGSALYRAQAHWQLAEGCASDERIEPST